MEELSGARLAEARGLALRPVGLPAARRVVHTSWCFTEWVFPTRRESAPAFRLFQKYGANAFLFTSTVGLTHAPASRKRSRVSR